MFQEVETGHTFGSCFLAVGNSSQILQSALAGCLRCKRHAAENPCGYSMKAPAPIWVDAWPQGETMVWAYGSILALLFCCLGREGCGAGAGPLTTLSRLCVVTMLFWSALGAQTTIHLLLAPSRLFLPVCLRWVTFSLLCVRHLHLSPGFHVCLVIYSSMRPL